MEIFNNRFRKLFSRAVSLALAAILTAVCCSPVATFAAARVKADPDLSAVPNPGAAENANTDALKEQIEALKKMIDLNVETASKVPILLYHHIAREADMDEQLISGGMTVSAEQFAEQMKYLSDNNYFVASLEEFEQWKAGRMPLPKKSVVITFDDGYRSNTKYAYPVLKKCGFRASIFLITSLIGRKENVIEHANWTDMKKCADVFSYYSHTHDLHKTAGRNRSALLTTGADAAYADILISKALLNAPFIAYPYGQRDDVVIGLVEDAGYRLAFTTDLEYAVKRGGKFETPRFTIGPAYDLLAFAKLCEGGGAPGGNGAPADASAGAPAGDPAGDPAANPTADAGSSGDGGAAQAANQAAAAKNAKYSYQLK